MAITPSIISHSRPVHCGGHISNSTMVSYRHIHHGLSREGHCQPRGMQGSLSVSLLPQSQKPTFISFQSHRRWLDPGNPTLQFSSQAFTKQTESPTACSPNPWSSPDTETVRHRSFAPTPCPFVCFARHNKPLSTGRPQHWTPQSLVECCFRGGTQARHPGGRYWTR